MALYLSELDANTRMKPSSKHYRRICIRKLQTTWPELWDKRISQIEEADCRAWAHQLRSGIAAQYFNNVIDTLRLIIDAGIKDHLRQGGKPFTNSARTVAKSRIPTKALDLPERDQFRAVVDFVRNRSSWGPKAADLVEFLAYSGLRLYTEVRHVRWEDIDWARKELVVRGSPETATKNWAIRRIPLLPDMLELLNRMKTQREEVGLPLSGKLLEVQECPVSLRQACAKLGIAHLRHHDLRHLFATRCIESGVDIPTVARWLGHKDGGGLAMRIYGHLRNEHSQEMAKKVKF